MLQVLRYEHLATVERQATAAAKAFIAKAGLGDRIPEPSVVRGIVADERLAKEVDNLGADGLIIGRQARAGSHRLVRLGRVARRLVRRLPAVTVVAPPELQGATIGSGPIMLATDLGPHGGPAAAFARSFAQATGRELVVAHVVPEATSAPAFLPAATVQQFYEQIGLDRQRDLQGWLRDHGLEGHASVVAEGDVVDRLVGMAANEGAPLIVCGSRGLDPVERVFTSSIATYLACHAPCAVAIVPP